jgi:hypothetical protein
MALCLAVQILLTAKALPLSAQGQGHHLASAHGGLWSRVGLGTQRGLVKVVHYHVKSSQEGVHIGWRSAPHLGED